MKKKLLFAAYTALTTTLSLYLLLGIFLPDWPEECAWSIALDNGRVVFCEEGYDSDETQEILDNWYEVD